MNNTVVITVRGTLSIEDAVTDVICHSTAISPIGVKWGYSAEDVENRYAHRGFLLAADRVRADLDRVGLLKKIMESDTEVRQSLE